jgi:hypothetical protein
MEGVQPNTFLLYNFSNLELKFMSFCRQANNHTTLHLSIQRWLNPHPSSCLDTPHNHILPSHA